MPLIGRLLPNFSVSRRAYSSFFSSKPGGGRYFNSAKPPKTAVVGTKNDGKRAQSLAESQSDTVQGSSNGGNENNPMRNIAEESAPSAQEQSDAASNNNPMSFADLFQQSNPHPVINSKDFKLHQFFSLHRPLLLLSNPPSIFHSAPPNGSIFGLHRPESESAEHHQQALPSDSALDSSVDADAEAARQLTRALTMNRAGSTVAWESTLKHLGLDVALDADRINLQQQFDKEWEDVMMDSTKRKRRKKMKKHKLKKRRKATRASRLKLS
ncbi:uncharacterized protein LACBIDRAFT_305874 [Laccaria bicolor S238N-H82]|uniref:Small ribosomal subunit protein mS38 n=1 Tax=Laccaria bicolor (strain S238N-H82 / ATCC MYA-4686) TaxID=486041 RepID=B0CS50_LACBS|nr:uncharacterized protein LACBIDRAFT_305874 [Laccaria bicolor S238N-H82]EDR14239.1 predicted protein [Laccaria bicolor S238N-H82]|eukprot:XP_001874798.1 predicted protein [Laccaria bicolor S238N-H82]